MFKKYLKLTAILLVSIFINLSIVSCNIQSKPEKVQNGFDDFMNELFVMEVQSDTLSLNYSLAEPEKYGIEIRKASLGEYSIDRMNQGLSLSENALERLESFDYSLLTPEQQLTYDIVQDYLKMDLSFGDYLYYNECLGPTTGIQAQLPILLAEYTFYEKNDIDHYLDLLKCVYDYFESIALFEIQKSEKGLFMSDMVADQIIAQCEAFIENPEKNFLIEYFNEKISDYEGLTREEIIKYQNQNWVTVMEYVIPAYKMLINVLKDLKGTGTNQAGLYYFPEGQAYYKCLVRYKTGSNKDLHEMADMLNKAISDGILEITTISLTDSDILNKYLSFSSFPITNPEEILSDLQKDISKDFPEAIPVNCEIKYVHESLADYLSPAMYLVPPIDNFTNNQIYINGNDNDTLSMIYTTVAHEGYPGHLYQCVYFRNQNPAPIRSIMNFLGYDEGWATYVELYSYQLSGIDKNLADFLAANNIVILCMYARADIGIHYEGWKRDQVVSYIMNFIDEEEIAESIYYTLLEEPAIYLPYAIGYLEIMELRNKAETTLGDHFVAKEFHEFLLDMGPAQFHVIEEYLDQWLEEMLK
ncbi:MAG TPA: DUF885 domain-containing protein [Clostridiales bacterium]|nr:DUF885 domain-containing protein [Clostridiales bacterium]